MDNNNWRPNPSQGPVVGVGGGVGGGGVGVPGGGGGEAAMDSVDWRSQLQPDSRQRIVNKIMETLKRHLPVSGQEGLHELRKIAIRFEEKIYTAATSQSDYLRKISVKMLTMDAGSQNPIGNALSSNSAGNSNKSPDAAMDECPLSLPENSPSMPNVQAPQSQYGSIEVDGQSEIVNVPIDVEDDEDDEDYNLSDFSQSDDDINEDFGKDGV